MDLLLTFVSLAVFTLMLDIGISQSPEQLTSLWRQPGLLLRSLLAVLVLVPAVVILVLMLIDTPSEVAVTLALLAASPGAPLTTRRSRLAGADVTYVSSLQLTLALMAVVVTPLILSVFYLAFDLPSASATPLQVGAQIAQVTLLPVLIGLAMQRLAPELTARLAKPLDLTAKIMFLLLILVMIATLVMIPELRKGFLAGWPALLAILIVAATAIVIGHALGGPEPTQRSGLATASLARNIGLALFIGELANLGEIMIPTLLAYMILGALLALPYSIWIKPNGRAMGNSSAAGSPRRPGSKG